MEQLKFRAWDKECKEMAEVTGINFEGSFIFPDPNVSISTRCDLMLFDDVELMQYTSINDNKGAEIYVGDIVKISMDDGFVFLDGVVATVEFYRGCFECRELDSMTYCLSEVQKIQVIGNIYENPELLAN